MAFSPTPTKSLADPSLSADSLMDLGKEEEDSARPCTRKEAKKVLGTTKSEERLEDSICQ